MRIVLRRCDSGLTNRRNLTQHPSISRVSIHQGVIVITRKHCHSIIRDDIQIMTLKSKISRYPLLTCVVGWGYPRYYYA